MEKDVFQLSGSVTFNLNEGREVDILSTNNAIKHIFSIMDNDLIQV